MVAAAAVSAAAAVVAASEKSWPSLLELVDALGVQVALGDVRRQTLQPTADST